MPKSEEPKLIDIWMFLHMKFKEMTSNDAKKELINMKAREMNRNFLYIALFFYGLFLLIFYLAAKRHIDVLVGF
ncbi:hypothetical protein Avbf_14513 [Armadillidium vulgare]|nr:hypothetical protein Avbf_14513 [Armadillidium vulgare]